MKKLVLFLAIVLIAAPAFATGTIVNSKHDLSTANAGTQQICVYCHTPHGADVSVNNAPLWNRTLSGFSTASSVYSSATLNVTIASTSLNGIDAPLCISCHAGTANMNAVINPPSSGLFSGTVGAMSLGSNAIIDTNLSNDHPINFDVSAAAADGEIRLAVIGEAPYKTVGATAPGTGIFQCSTCHDVHNGGGYAPLTVQNMAGSKMCLDCHIK